MSVRYQLERVGMRFDGAAVLQDVTLEFARPELVTLIGPNGAGKSTLLNIMAGLRRGFDGRCLLDGRPVLDWRRREFARKVAFVPQTLRFDFPFTADEVVLMGRTPYAGGFFDSDEDWQAAREAMQATDTLALAGRDFRSLSGGERQRVMLAAALAQRPRALLLDEPAAFLDLHHQLMIYSLLRQLARGGLLVIAVTHDVNLAASYSDRVIALRAGRVVADATPCDALSAERIRQVFGVNAEWLRRSGGGAWIAYGD
ncbi:ABC transporter ATP-binding protein [Thermus sp.]|uniref:ABC transporter ATP-binding protein n=1 Tax=Thermus sp. TaxID=275 RepID=UPI0026233D26|nr:ABC transporter ATP-binding protein [Thermus sp.]MCX7850919.1 ABC transporter ATP-binding protein [Thermus sp.]